MKNIYITVDLECHDIVHRNQYIEGKYKNGVCGLEHILRLGKELNIPINFFFDMVEAKEYGEEYAKDIIELIHKYNQHVYLHLHPDYVSGDHEKSFFWQYNYQDKKEILQYGFDLFQRLLGHEPKAFRIGRYGADEEMYDAMKEMGISLVDLSYSSGSSKMCHLGRDTAKVDNAIIRFKGQTLFPNTRYRAIQFGRKSKLINLDTNDSTFNEYRRFLDKNELGQITLTMHSWNFIKKYFFSKNYVSLDKRAEKKFRKMISYGKKKGYVFSDFTENPPVVGKERDQVIDLCTGLSGKVQMLCNNFLRFQKIGRLNKKYFAVYAIFYILIILICIAVIWNMR
ncbi:polysaccharide deacetylase family protein [[Clostridium] polysaccharolyticum]|uniref:Polysaccharide deacetylase n=1 Tax=[Clostridium] polysaccharolyticum TaxID=29364 RepID=A0A1H9ZCJ0_9FIRM|nr:hypothetical protein [[Clostridium] polysaccharolyticum]SES79050.1 hypothetical protein SAMN04487772_103120 [[Clostridium] polysaccharolyticum]